MLNIKHWSLLIILSVIISACGGGDDSNDNSINDTRQNFTASAFTDVNCSKFKRIPNEGNHCCTGNNLPPLCWKTGPKRDNKDKEHKKLPHYFELAHDFQIELTDFLNDYENLPQRKEDKEKETVEQTRTRLANLLTVMQDCINFDTRSNEIKWDYLRFVDGTMKVKKGYRWDGESRLGRTLGNHMQAAFIHDTFYDLIRLEYLPCVGWDEDNNEEEYRELGDMMFFLIARKAGRNKDGATGAWKILRNHGDERSTLHIEETIYTNDRDKVVPVAWRFYTLADAAVSADGVDMQVDDAGNKTFTMSCARESDGLVFDASASRPFAESPRQGQTQDNVHETTWRWDMFFKTGFINLVQPNQNHFGQGFDMNALQKTLTVGELINKGLVLGDWNYIFLQIDREKNTDKARFFNMDLVKVKVELDTESPVISGITEPITARPPDHRYRTFTIGDFVSSVSDNCSILSLDKLVITKVTSNEPDNTTVNGDNKDDIVIAVDGKSVDLRIESEFVGNGRIYTIYIKAVDKNGNTTTESFQVRVPLA